MSNSRFGVRIGGGMTRIVEEGPTRVKIECDMKTDGVIVLSDRWDEGWKAYLNGKHVPVVRANHSIRAVAVSAGTGSLEFRYEPGTFTLGLLLAGTATMALACWVLVLRCTG